MAAQGHVHGLEKGAEPVSQNAILPAWCRRVKSHPQRSEWCANFAMSVSISKGDILILRALSGQMHQAAAIQPTRMS